FRACGRETLRGFFDTLSRSAGAAFFNAARQDTPSLDGLNTGAEFLLPSLLPPPYHKDQIKRCKGDFGRWASGCANRKN
ncbi:MAG: hypothetical protein ACI3VP_07570, partial [Oscillospiraceae bacterium]